VRRESSLISVILYYKFAVKLKLFPLR